MTLMEQLSAYIPYNEQEARDRVLLLDCLRREPEVLTRQNALAHFTASAWIVNPTRTRVLMAYHNIYHSWSWLGGHADGESDLLAVALREAREESGIRSARPVSENIFSLEALTIKPDENSGVRWFTLEESETAPTEPWFCARVYRKLNDKLRAMAGPER